MRFVDAEIKDVLRLLAKEYKLNLVISENVGGTITVDFEEVLLEDIFYSLLKTAGLGYTVRGDVVVIATQKELLEQETARVKELEKQAEAKKKILESQEMISETIKVKYILNTRATESIAKELAVGKGEMRNLTQLAESLKKMLSDRKGASIEVVDAANALVVTDIPERVEQIKKLVQELDQPSSQIMIEAKVTTIDSDSLRDLGIKWGGKIKDKDLMVSGQREREWATESSKTTGTTPSTSDTKITSDTGSIFGVDFPAAIEAGKGATLGLLWGNLKQDFLDVELSALEERGNAKILATPRVITQDNQRAYIKVGDEIPFQEYTVVGGAITT
ncbi:MAG: hypothetical protein N3A64_00060, partial [Desulfobacterota bacterium]|nr:hypothetical protein [Thermodesulfobacteriota bacterium]